jgi:hypothetical protein
VDGLGPVAHELKIDLRRVANLRLQGIRGGPLAAMVETKRSVARSYNVFGSSTNGEG